MNLGRVAVFSLLLAALTGCASKTYWANASYTFPVRVTETAAAIVLPVRIALPNLNPDEASGAFMAGIVAECPNCLPAQPLQPVLEQNGLGDLGLRLADGLYQMGSTGAVNLDGALAAIVIGSLDLINGAFPDAGLRYIITGNVASLGGGMVPNTTRVRIQGGLYDVQERRPVSAFWYEETIINDTALASIGLMGQKIIQLSECPMDDDSCAEQQAALGLEGVHVVHF